MTYGSFPIINPKIYPSTISIFTFLISNIFLSNLIKSTKLPSLQAKLKFHSNLLMKNLLFSFSSFLASFSHSLITFANSLPFSFCTRVSIKKLFLPSSRQKAKDKWNAIHFSWQLLLFRIIFFLVSCKKSLQFAMMESTWIFLLCSFYKSSLIIFFSSFNYCVEDCEMLRWEVERGKSSERGWLWSRDDESRAKLYLLHFVLKLKQQNMAEHEIFIWL